MRSRRRRAAASTRPRSPRTALVGVAAALLTVAAGCSWSSQEPGLFRTAAPQPSEPAPSPSTAWTPSYNNRLPVLGERIWSSADGSDLTFRIAVQAVRRFRGGTALDWSVTPLPRAHDAVGDLLPEVVDLGLTRFSEGNLNITLLDRRHGTALRPLTANEPDTQQHCLCTPPWVIQRTLRFGVTTLLQAAYPALPADVGRVDVDISTVPIFSAVPVTPLGRAPFGELPVELGRPAAVPRTLARTAVFSYPSPPGQKLQLGVVEVLAGRSSTSVEWSIESRSSGNEITGITVPPLVATDHDQRYGYAGGYASAPTVVAVDGTRRRPGLVAQSLSTRLSGLDQPECLCTDMRLWTKGLERSGQRATVVADLPPLPAGTRRVDIAFPGLPTLRDLPVTHAPDPAGNPVVITRIEPSTWTFRMEAPGPGWAVGDWPTPLPNSRQLGGYQATVDDVR